MHGGPVEAHDLRAAMRAAVLEVLNGDGSRGGTAFFVAPGYALTCAHVVNGRKDARLRVRWEDRLLNAQVVHTDPPPDGSASVWPLPDLAVLRIDQAPTEHPCVWLGERLPPEGEALYAYGYGGAYGSPEPTPMLLDSAGVQGRPGARAIRLRNDELPAGSSGSPVLNDHTGEVCALVKTARSADLPHGGLAVPLDRLRDLPAGLLRKLWQGHDRHHAADPSWANAIDRLRHRRVAGIPREVIELLHPDFVQPVLRATEEAKLRGILARLPAAPDAQHLYEQACHGWAPSPAQPLLDRRDVVRALDDVSMARRGELHPLLIFAKLLSRHHPGTDAVRLDEWAAELAARLGQHRQFQQLATGQLPAPRSGMQNSAGLSDPRSVLVEVTPDGHDRERYLLTVSLYRSQDDIRSFEQFDEPMAAQRLAVVLPGLLRTGLLQFSSAHTVMIELVLPPELLDLPLDEWSLSQGDIAPIGLRRPVVVRMWDNGEGINTGPEAEARWKAAQDGTAGIDFEIVECGTETDPQWFFAQLNTTGRTAVLLPGPARDRRYQVLLESGAQAGMSVALWNRTGCPEHGQPSDGESSPCRGSTFLADLARELRTETIDSLPLRVRKLRNAAVAARDDNHCGHRLVLLWDNPFRHTRDEAFEPLW